MTHACDAYLFQEFNDDKVVQASAGQAWLDGHAFSTAVVSRSGEVSRVPVVQWPPGYSIAYAAMRTSLVDPFRATYAIDLLSVLAFFLAWYLICATMISSSGPSRPSREPGHLAMWLYWGLAFSPITRLRSSDLLALALYSVALAALLRAPAGRIGLPRFVINIIAGIAAGAAGAVRYAYWPLAVVPIASAIVGRKPRAIGGAIAYLIAAMIPLAWAYANVAGVQLGAAVPQSTTAPLWAQLGQLPPFGATLLGAESAWSRLAISWPAIAWLLVPLFWTLTAVVIYSGLVSALRARRSEVPAMHMFALSGGWTFVVTLGLIALLTLRVPAYPDGWTYAADAARYLAPAYPFLAVALFDSAARVRDSRRRYAGWIVLALVGMSVAGYRAGQLAAYVDHNRHVMPSGSEGRAQMRAVFASIRGARMDRPSGHEVLYCDTDLTRQYFAIMAGAAAPRQCDDRLLTATPQNVIKVVMADK
jgi:hypothetical protein